VDPSKRTISGAVLSVDVTGTRSNRLGARIDGPFLALK
jgi:hypothetical protein